MQLILYILAWLSAHDGIERNLKSDPLANFRQMLNIPGELNYINFFM